MKLTGLVVFLLITSNSLLSQSLKSSYTDGTHTGSSRASYVDEPYWGIVKFTVKEGMITDVNFTIRDSARHETFNLDYARHFAGNDLYIQQTKNDWNGVRMYPEKLMKAQDIGKVDAITGATWSYNIFKASFLEALK